MLYGLQNGSHENHGKEAVAVAISNHMEWRGHGAGGFTSGRANWRNSSSAFLPLSIVFFSFISLSLLKIALTLPEQAS